MKNTIQNNEISKRDYIAPSIEVTFIEMEYGIWNSGRFGYSGSGESWITQYPTG